MVSDGVASPPDSLRCRDRSVVRIFQYVGLRPLFETASLGEVPKDLESSRIIADTLDRVTFIANRDPALGRHEPTDLLAVVEDTERQALSRTLQLFAPQWPNEQHASP